MNITNEKSNDWHLLRHPFVVITVVLFLSLVGCVFWAFSHYTIPADSQANPILHLMPLRMLQAVLGLLIGVTFALLGVVLTWFGVNAPLQAEFGDKTVQGKLVTTSPGIVLILCGTIVIVVALTQKLEVRSDGAFQEPNSQHDSAVR